MKSWIEISRTALRHNAAAIRSLVKPTKMMAVVKANAYGHGIVETSKSVANLVDWFGVDRVEEAEQIRSAGIKKPILILGYTNTDDLKRCADLGCFFVAYNLDSLAQIRKDRSKRIYRIHLKIETGTSRQGLSGRDLVSFIKTALKLKNVRLEGAYTHFANIEDTTDPSYALEQIQRFEEELFSIKKLGVKLSVIHAASSAGAILYPKARYSMIRLGISLYGHWPSKETEAVAKQKRIKLKLQPALSWKATIAQVKTIPRGAPVSYGLTERVSRNSIIAVIPVGYSDGYDRGLSSIGQVLIHGRACKVLGRVCMNMMVVDVTDVPRVKNGDIAVLIGSQKTSTITAEDLASKCGTIPYEVLSRINSMIQRILV
ncbi:MAG: alanine racemase [Patescibacteria group bacterium]